VPTDGPHLRFLSHEWIAALDGARIASDAPVSIVIEQHVVDGDDVITWHVVIDDHVAHVRSGPADQAAHVTFVQDRATATAITRGELNAQLAFIDGRVRLTGDVRVLIDHADVFARLDDAWRPVRERTTYA
jgi:alkyl sulfatase BDS1-like metallo-beta-lactamase superfamily hydrolase